MFIDSLPKYIGDDTSGNANDEINLRDIKNIINPKSPCAKGKSLFTD